MYIKNNLDHQNNLTEIESKLGFVFLEKTYINFHISQYKLTRLAWMNIILKG